MNSLEAVVDNLESLILSLRTGALNLDAIDDNMMVVSGPHSKIGMKDLLIELLNQPKSIYGRRWLMVQRIRREIKALNVGFDEEYLERILLTMSRMPREEFVDPRIADYAYLPYALSIGQDQTISQPYMVVIMLLSAGLKPTDTVLDIGTGSGYQAAIISKLVKRVVSVEIREELAMEARAAFARLKLSVESKVGDGLLGSPSDGPYDAIVVAAAARQVSAPLLAQLKVGGKLIVPIRVTAANEQLYVLTKNGDGAFHRCSLGPCYFVPVAGAADVPGDQGTVIADLCHGVPITSPLALPS